METKVYNQKGKEVGIAKISEKGFGFSWNPNLVKQVFLAEQAGKRSPIAHTKDRSEVSGGGKKPWQQKGTGRARHGSIRSPIWIGGGIAHGPRNARSYEEKVNKKVHRRALLTIISRKLRDGEILFLDDLKISEAKTKQGQEVLKNLPIRRGASTLVVLPGKDEATWKALRNIKNVTLIEARNLNASELLNNKFVIMPQDSGRILEETFSK